MSDKRPPMSAEEFQALVEELRADPVKAAVFKDQLKKKFDAALARLPQRPVPLHRLISAAFSFLVDEYGFTEHEDSQGGRFGSVTIKEYSSKDVGICISVGGYDISEFCAVFFTERKTGRYIEIHDWLARRNVVFERCLQAVSFEQEMSHLQAYATIMREHAADLLRGDFSAVPD